MDLAGFPDPGSHPITKQPFVECQMTAHSNDQRFTYERPSPPSRELWSYDDEVPVYVRDHTDEEMAQLEAEYRKAVAEWQRTGGEFWSKGQRTIEAEFTCADGAWMRAMLNERKDEWIVVEASTGRRK